MSRSIEREEKGDATVEGVERHLLGGRRVLGDGLGALRDGVLGQLTGEDESYGGLDLAR